MIPGVGGNTGPAPGALAPRLTPGLALLRTTFRRTVSVFCGVSPVGVTWLGARADALVCVSVMRFSLPVAVSRKLKGSLIVWVASGVSALRAGGGAAGLMTGMLPVSTLNRFVSVFFSRNLALPSMGFCVMADLLMLSVEAISMAYGAISRMFITKRSLTK